MKVEEVSSDEMQLMGALQDPDDCWLEEPKAQAVEVFLEEARERETLGPPDEPRCVPKEEPLPDQKSDSPNAEETWEWSTDESCSGWCPGGGPSPGAGAGTLIKADQQPPGEGPVNLEMQRTSPGRLGERGSLIPELGQVQKGLVRPPKQEESLELQQVFEDVAMYFTQKEWELLEDDDKVLYRDQMLRNYQALVSLGYFVFLC
ncbi:hypothetical protein Y1Q_0007009 [Alligator mississippiensis]|uniref:Uncharacterized protein n=1 Tax=Alligator mississippiensis TaxID=8496 RepID=A0A151NX01_ALLMI|nr:hypothetical protein Y1Q_0007009 [Alligator mississippiensis]